MSEQLTDRLNAILPRIVSDDFLSGNGIGNEIAFYVFDYDPQDEIRVRQHIDSLVNHVQKQKPGLRVKHVNLFDLLIDYLRSRNLLERSFKMQKEKGDEHLLHALTSVLDAEKVAEVFTLAADPVNHDLVLVSGVGTIWPMMRTHNLLNNLHSKMGKTPLVMFYPGRYDGQALRLFGKLRSDNYYRAFKLVP